MRTIRQSPRQAVEGGRRPPFSRYGVVLLLLTAVFTFAMVAPGTAWAHLVSAVLQGGAVLVALARANADRRLVAAAVAAIAVTVAAASVAAGGATQVGGVADLTAGGLLVLVPVAIVVEYRRKLEIDVESILAAVCIYVVLGMFFASIASAVSAIGGAAYFAGHPTATSADYVYFSFITLATVGYGDLVPVLGMGRALAVLEGLTGQLYLVTVVGLVVGRLRAGPDR